MRTDKKIARYIEKNGREIKNYSAMCKILGEKPTSGEGKKNQLDKWRMYFDYEREGHKYYIVEIYDDKTVKANEEMNKTKKNMKHILERSKYRKEIISVLLYLLKKENSDNIRQTKISLAKSCGFFNKDVIDTRKYHKYIEFRTERKAILGYKNYFKADIDEETYYEYTNSIRKSAYKAVMNTLKVLADSGILEYEMVNVGNTYNESRLLDKDEEKIYKECKEEACNNVLELYNQKVKEKKDKIELKDFVMIHNIREAYYEWLGSIVKEKLGFTSVMENYDIYLTVKGDELIKEFDEIKTPEEYHETINIINTKFIETLKNNIDTQIKKDEEFNMTNEFISMSFGSEFKRENNQIGYGKKEEIEYYNKSEIIDLLVSHEQTTDAIDIDEYIEQNRERVQEKIISEDEICDETKKILEMITSVS